MAKLTILPEWQQRLAKNGLAELESLLQFNQGHCLSSHKRGKTFRHQLEDGQLIYIKIDYFSFLRETIKDLLQLRQPQPNGEKERKAYKLLRETGYQVPKLIAWGQKRRFGLPHQGAFVMLPLDGIPLNVFIQNEADEKKRRAVIEQAELTLMQMQKQGLCWPDCKPEHFFVMRNGGIGLVDVERLKKMDQPLSPEICQEQFEHFHCRL